MTTSTPSEATEPLGALWRPTPLSALELRDIPTELHFVRDHFPAPQHDLSSWSLELRGSSRSLVVDLDTLRTLPRRTLSVVLECAGHRRVEFEPIPAGLPWSIGAIAEARWTGASLAALLALVGIPPDASEVVMEGTDCGPVDGFDGIHRFARSLPLEKALDHDVLLADEMNGEPIPRTHGGPVRSIVPGWYATDSVKWIDRIWFTPEQFDGVFQAHDYLFREPGEPGTARRMTELPVHAMITAPADGETVLAGKDILVQGTAWGGTGGIADVLVQIDRGAWSPARLGRVRGQYARLDWEARHTLAPGTHEIACRAIDGEGATQPDRPPPNVHGYGNNAIHRVTFQAA